MKGYKDVVVKALKIVIKISSLKFTELLSSRSLSFKITSNVLAANFW